ncbi:uncharacterized protein FA14DRAFT_159392 [Meira miltonrushii]|uniref:Uncharacterized protein n=1 Tax=Meira miltonrushii TaxID=1280837 RepID=A0A316VID2_9BASI|nr:uncharacterized protein FA14DRAFT_159392 [Meira miltonrushii]PWN37260.1 hypothetical protein FA14DRAFT_159392 [Meira miltonrushii]
MPSPKDDNKKPSIESIRLAENRPSSQSQHAQAQQSEMHTLASQEGNQRNTHMIQIEQQELEESGKKSPSSQRTIDEKHFDHKSSQYDVEAASLPKMERKVNTTEEEETSQDDADEDKELNDNPKQRMHVSMFSNRDDKNQPPSKQPGFDDLFFDLLLTACLSVYGNNADLASASKIGVFIGYFSLLWWSWWSQTLFDVRFRGRDRFGFYMQCGQRIVRSTCLGVWVAFATVSSEFARGGYTNFTTIYVCSRGTLIADYLLVIARTYIHKTKFWDDDIPFAVERRERSHISERQCHLIIIGGTLISMALWIASPYVVDNNHTLPPAVIGMWIAGIAVEMVAEMIVEIFGSLRSISATPIVERLALFSLMVFGNGFENIGQALNQISPGSRDFNRGGLPVGGWSTLTVLNAAASVIIVTLLFFGYFSRAIKEFVAHPARIMTWCYAHIVLHIASAVLMIGLGKVILYVNTLSGLVRFGQNASIYLPDDEGWLNYLNSTGPDETLNNGTIPALDDIQNYYARSIIAIFATITSLQGAIIPDVDLANALANSTEPFKNVQLPPAASTAIGNYANVITGMQQTDSLDQYLSQNAYNFYYVYLCPAVYMFGDIALKLLQHSANGWRSIERPIIISQSIRLFFGVALVLVQIGYLIELGHADPETLAVECCLIILACIMMLESFLQIILLFMPTFHKIYRRHILRKRRGSLSLSV